MTPEDQHYYQQLGQRIAERRKAQQLTQQQLAAILGISQQTLAHYEVDRLRVAVSMLPPLAKILEISVAELLEPPVTERRSKSGPASTLQRQFEQVALLPRARQKMITQMLDALIDQQKAS